MTCSVSFCFFSLWLSLMKRLTAGIAGLFLLLSGSVQAGIIVGGTRVIYQEGSREASVSVTNADSHTPYLIQSWIENYQQGDKTRAPFIVTPPLFRLDPEQKNVLRINFIGTTLPADRESVYWLNVKSISPSQKGVSNKLQVNIKSKFKLFYRPDSLPGDSAKAWQTLCFHLEGKRLIAKNPSPWFVSLFSLSVGGKEIDEPGMIGPFETREWPVTSAGEIRWRAINDFGGITDYARQ